MLQDILKKAKRIIEWFTMPVLNNPGVFVTVALLLSIPLLSRILFKAGIIDFFCKGIILGHVRIGILPIVFITAYIVCLMKHWLKLGKCLAWTIALLVACDLFLAINFEMGISPVSVQLLFQTNASESYEFLNAYIWTASNLKLFLTIILICIIGLSEKLNDRMVLLLFKHKLFWSYIVLALLFLPIFFFQTQVKGIARLIGTKSTHSLQLFVDILPDDVLTKTIYSFKSVMAATEDIEVLISTTSKTTVDSCRFSSPNIVVVIGESFNKHHSNLYGYKMDTNPFLTGRKERGELFVFTNAVTPFNSTGEAMRYMLSSARARHGSNWAEHPLFPTVFKKAGYNVTWMDNHVVAKTDCSPWDFLASYFIYEPTVMKESFDKRNQKTFRYDGQLIDCLTQNIYSGVPANSSDENLVVIHLMGQHVGYASRYPHEERYEHFTSDSIRRSDLSASDRSVIADFDNATRYNDEVIDRICSYFEDNDAILVYLSDHGDEVNDYRLHIGRSHSRPVTPGEVWTQYEIPMMIWCSNTYRKNHPDMVEKIATSVDKPFMSDDLPHLLYDLAGIESLAFNPAHSILNPSYSLKERPLLQSEDMIYEEIIKGWNHENPSTR